MVFYILDYTRPLAVTLNGEILSATAAPATMTNFRRPGIKMPREISSSASPRSLRMRDAASRAARDRESARARDLVTPGANQPRVNVAEFSVYDDTQKRKKILAALCVVTVKGRIRAPDERERERSNDRCAGARRGARVGPHKSH